MDREHDEHGMRRAVATAGRQAAARFARDEVADVLADALWSLICAGRWPGSGTAGASHAATLSEHRPNGPQHVETTGL